MLKDKIEQDIIAALKTRDSVGVAALRLLKARIQAEEIAKGGGLEEDNLQALIRSQIKRHKEAAEGFKNASRAESFTEEMQQAAILAKYLPPDISEEEIQARAVELVTANSWTDKDFGIAMKIMKNEMGSAANGAVLSRILKDLLQKT